jgi:hypothetical protein
MKRRSGFLWFLLVAFLLAVMVGGCGGGGGNESSGSQPEPQPTDPSEPLPDPDIFDLPILSDEEQIDLFENGYAPVLVEDVVFPDGTSIKDYLGEVDDYEFMDRVIHSRTSVFTKDTEQPVKYSRKDLISYMVLTGINLGSEWMNEHRWKWEKNEKTGPDVDQLTGGFAYI